MQIVKQKKRISKHFCSNLIDALTTPSSAGKFGAEIRLNIEFIIDDLFVSSVSTTYPADLVTSYILKWETSDFLESLKISKWQPSAVMCPFFLVHGFCFGNSR